MSMFYLSEKNKLCHSSCPFLPSLPASSRAKFHARLLYLILSFCNYLLFSHLWFLSSGVTRNLEKCPWYLFAWISILLGSSYEHLLGLRKLNLVISHSFSLPGSSWLRIRTSYIVNVIIQSTGLPNKWIGECILYTKSKSSPTPNHSLSRAGLQDPPVGCGSARYIPSHTEDRSLIHV